MACENHELACRKNPINFRPCVNCANLVKKKTLIYAGFDDYNSGEPVNLEREFFFCNKKDIFLYTPQNEIKGNFVHINNKGGLFDNRPMPKECNDLSTGWN